MNPVPPELIIIGLVLGALFNLFVYCIVRSGDTRERRVK